MNADHHKMSVRLVQSRMPELQLTFDQAEKILAYEHEQSRDTSVSLSTWEKLDYQHFVYSSFLDPGQMLVFEEFKERQIEHYVDGLVRRNASEITGPSKNAAPEFNYGLFLSKFFEDPELLCLNWLTDEKNKLGFLRSRYQKFLFNKKQQLIVDHLRYYRHHLPAILEAELRGSSVSCFWPDFIGFLRQMDAPTRSAFRFLKRQTVDFRKSRAPFFSERFREHKNFYMEQIRYFEHLMEEDSSMGSIFVGKMDYSKKDEDDQKAMLLFLLKKEGYRW